MKQRAHPRSNAARRGLSPGYGPACVGIAVNTFIDTLNQQRRVKRLENRSPAPRPREKAVKCHPPLVGLLERDRAPGTTFGVAIGYGVDVGKVTRCCGVAGTAYSARAMRVKPCLSLLQSRNVDLTFSG
ncbi:hypothetical protein J6590_030238 [Homalodisca vitripennis]|nr:hypothetical protein J6590_030238 [Homalodisca vitripennis]